MVFSLLWASSAQLLILFIQSKALFCHVHSLQALKFGTLTVVLQLHRMVNLTRTQ